MSRHWVWKESPWRRSADLIGEGDELHVLDVNGDNFDDASVPGVWYFGSPAGLTTHQTP